MTYHPTPPACANDCADDIAVGFELRKRVQRGCADACERYIRRVLAVNGVLFLFLCLSALAVAIVAPSRPQPIRALLCAGGILDIVAALLVLRHAARTVAAAIADLREARATLAQTEEDSAAFTASRREKP